MAPPVHDPLQPLPDPAHEKYVQQRALGLGPTEAAAAVGLKNFRLVERHASFRARLEALLRSAAEHDSTITLGYLVVELKRTAASARGAGQHKNANEALRQLAELYVKHPELRGEVAAKSEPAKAVAPTELAAKRAAREARLSAVPAEAAGE
jgi:hypothetical protein